MKSIQYSIRRAVSASLLGCAFLSFPITSVRAANVAAVLDNCANAQLNARGAARILITDKDLGGHSAATETCQGGILAVKGELAPGRGQPGFVTMVSLLTPTGQPEDLSRYQGVRLRVKVTQGNLSVQVGSSDITNFDYHTSAPLVRDPAGFQEVRVPFSSLKRMWSEQVPLNTKVVTSVNLVAAGMAPGPFAYEVESLGFY